MQWITCINSFTKLQLTPSAPKPLAPLRGFHGVVGWKICPTQHTLPRHACCQCCSKASLRMPLVSLPEEKHKKLCKIQTRWLLAGWKAGICPSNKTNVYVVQGKRLKSKQKNQNRDCNLHIIIYKLHVCWFWFFPKHGFQLPYEFNVSTNYIRSPFPPENTSRCQSYTSGEMQQNTALFCYR